MNAAGIKIRRGGKKKEKEKKPGRFPPNKLNVVIGYEEVSPVWELMERLTCSTVRARCHLQNPAEPRAGYQRNL